MTYDVSGAARDLWRLPRAVCGRGKVSYLSDGWIIMEAVDIDRTVSTSKCTE